MEDSFMITISYNHKNYGFESSILMQGYQHKIAVNIADTLVLFEPDEERNYRAIGNTEEMSKNKTISIGLLEAIASYLATMLK